MFTTTPYKLNTRVRIRNGEYADEEAVVLKRWLKPAPEPVFEYASGGEAPEVCPSPEVQSWTYRVRLRQSSKVLELDHESLITTQGTEWDDQSKE
jgi:hypothetical protein